jgi:hypothetical protein
VDVVCFVWVRVDWGLTSVFAGVLEFLAGEEDGISGSAFGFTPAFGRVEGRFAAGFRREAKASLYLVATAKATANAKTRARAKANAGVSPLRHGR